MCITTRINMTETGKNIARLRKINGLSIREIQEAMGFNTPQAIFKWQRGETLPSIDNLIVLSELYSISIDEIIIKEK
ncbi:MAG: helix-turn-helix transcriptional regulator [Erysipelotrichaceae bacterium]|nr:helix-turn-helix transcriptional regulator [Erysipelotrichaceae bacterium]